MGPNCCANSRSKDEDAAQPISTVSLQAKAQEKYQQVQEKGKAAMQQQVEKVKNFDYKGAASVAAEKVKTYDYKGKYEEIKASDRWALLSQQVKGLVKKDKSADEHIEVECENDEEQRS